MVCNNQLSLKQILKSPEYIFSKKALIRKLLDHLLDQSVTLNVQFSFLLAIKSIVGRVRESKNMLVVSL